MVAGHAMEEYHLDGKTTGNPDLSTWHSIYAPVASGVNCFDREEWKSLGTLLTWLRRWRRGDFNRSKPERKAGALPEQSVWFWGEVLCLQALEDLEPIDERRCGGRRPATGKKTVRFVDLNSDFFNGDFEIQAQVEEWLEPAHSGPTIQRGRSGATGEKGTDGRPWLPRLLGLAGNLRRHHEAGGLRDQGRAQTSRAWDTTAKMHRLWIVLNSMDR